MRDLLDEAIGASPASTVDVDRVVAAGRRRIRLRRLALASPTVPAVAAVALAVTTLGGSPTAPSDSIALQPGAAGSGAAPVYTETPEQTRQRLETTLADHLAAALPGATVTSSPSGDPGVVVTVSDEPTRYDSSVVLSTADGENQLFLVSQPGSEPAILPSGPPSSVGWATWFDSCAQVPTTNGTAPEGYTLTTSCEESAGVDGQTIVVLSTVCVDCPAGPVTLRHDAYVTWTNARVVVGIINTLKPGEPGTTSLAELLLTPEQLVTIASDPELTVAG